MAVAIKETSERELIIGTLSDIEDSIQELTLQIDALTVELDAKHQRLATWRKRLETIDGPAQAGNRRRRPKGENLRAIKACIENAATGLAASEVRTRTGIPWSSVQRVLTQHTELFVEVNGLWKIRQRTPRVALNLSNGPRIAKPLPVIDHGGDEEVDPFEPDDETPAFDADEEEAG